MQLDKPFGCSPISSSLNLNVVSLHRTASLSDIYLELHNVEWLQTEYAVELSTLYEVVSSFESERQPSGGPSVFPSGWSRLVWLYVCVCICVCVRVRVRVRCGRARLSDMR